MSEQLYFIAIVPPEDIQKEITELKQFIASRFGSRHALNAPPHITLHMPFRWKDKKIELLHETIAEINKEISPFEVELNGFDFFEPRVVFVSVNKNLPLEELQRLVVSRCSTSLKLDNANYKNQVFHPHVTIGFRDLRKRMFYAAKEHFEKKAIDCRFQVNRIELLKHNGKKWNIMSQPF